MAVELIHQAQQQHNIEDMIVVVERTGNYHLPPKRAFARAGFETRVVHPFATKQFRMPADPGNKTDETDLYAQHRAAVAGFGLFRQRRPALDDEGQIGIKGDVFCSACSASLRKCCFLRGFCRWFESSIAHLCNSLQVVATCDYLPHSAERRETGYYHFHYHLFGGSRDVEETKTVVHTPQAHRPGSRPHVNVGNYILL